MYVVEKSVTLYLAEIDIERCVQDSIRIFCLTPKSATYREHAKPSRREKEAKERPTISYYSQDYNEHPKTDLVGTRGNMALIGWGFIQVKS